MKIAVRLRMDRAWEKRYARIGPGWYEAERITQDEVLIQIPGRPSVAGDLADFEARQLVR